MKNMKFEIKTEALISAPVEVVWETLVNFENYKNWNPFIYDVVGTVNIRDKVKITLQDESKNKMSFKARILENEKNREFRWIGKLWVAGLFDGEHSFVLEKISANQTKLIHSEEFNGILVKPFLKTLQTKTKYNFERMNNALKLKLEQS